MSMRASLLLSIVLSCGVAAAQTIELAPRATGTAPRPTSGVRAAGTATESLAVWISNGGLYAIRVDFLGRPMDERSFEIATSGVLGAEVATDGSDYLVAYTSCRSSTDCDVRFATILRDGTMFPTRQRIAGGRVQALAWGGERYVLAWSTDSRSITGSLAFRDRRGFVIEDRILLQGESITAIKMASDGEGTLGLLWFSRRGTFFAAATLDEIRRGTVREVRMNATVSSIAGSRSGFIVTGTSGTFSRRVWLFSRSGTLESMTSTIGSLTDYRGGATASARFEIYSTPQRSLNDLLLQMRLLDRPDTERTVVPDRTTWSFDVDIASTTDGGAVLAWDQEIHEGVSEVRVVRVMPTGTLLRFPHVAVQPVNRGFVQYDTPVVRRCGDVFMTAWVERSDRRSVRFRRVSLDGVPLDPPSRRATSLSPNDQRGVSIACTGDAVLLTWTEISPIAVTRTSVGRGLLLSGGREHLVDLGPAEDVYATGIGGELAVMREVSNDWHEGSHWTIEGTQRTPWLQMFHQPDCDDRLRSVESRGDEIVIATTNPCAPIGGPYVLARRFSRELESLGPPVIFQGGGGMPDLAAAPDGWLLVWGQSEAAFGMFNRGFITVDPRRGVLAGGSGPAGAAWNGCAFEVIGPDRVTSVPVLTKVDLPIVVQRVASDGPGSRLIVTTERDDDGAMRVVARREDSPRCLR